MALITPGPTAAAIIRSTDHHRWPVTSRVHTNNSPATAPIRAAASIPGRRLDRTIPIARGKIMGLGLHEPECRSLVQGRGAKSGTKPRASTDCPDEQSRRLNLHTPFAPALGKSPVVFKREQSHPQRARPYPTCGKNVPRSDIQHLATVVQPHVSGA